MTILILYNNLIYDIVYLAYLSKDLKERIGYLQPEKLDQIYLIFFVDTEHKVSKS
jgi:hypothetical protein